MYNEVSNITITYVGDGGWEEEGGDTLDAEQLAKNVAGLGAEDICSFYSNICNKRLVYQGDSLWKIDENPDEFTFSVTLNRNEIEYLRAAIADLGWGNADCRHLQTKVANALIDAGYTKK